MPSDRDKPAATDAPFGPAPGAWSPSIRCRNWEEAHQTTAAMQRGGVLLRTPAPPPVGSQVHLTLKLPDVTEVVLVGSVMQIVDPPENNAARRGAIVRFRVAAPIVAQFEARAWKEGNRDARPATPLARGSAPGDSPLPTTAAPTLAPPTPRPTPRPTPAPRPVPHTMLTDISDASSEDTATRYSFHRKPKKS